MIDRQRFPEVSYPAERATRLIDVLGTQLVLIIKRKWLAKDIMQEPFNDIKEDLKCSIQLLEEFLDTIKNLNLARSHGVIGHPIVREFVDRLQEVSRTWVHISPRSNSIRLIRFGT